MKKTKFNFASFLDKKSTKDNDLLVSRIQTIGIVAGLCIICIAGYMLFRQLTDYWKSSDIYDATISVYVTTADIPKDDTDVSDDMTDVLEWDELIEVDLAGLRKVNKDIVGWIYLENSDISYPLLYSGDDSKYLRKTYTGEGVSAGSIFVEGENSSDFSDAHTLIYGHNMKDLSMFGTLKYYESDKEYINDHEYIQIITGDRKYRYKIFAYKIVPEDSDVYQVFKDGGNEFFSFVNDVLKSGNHMRNDEIVKFDDHVITLSTCTNDDQRLVVSAVRVDEFEY